MIVVFLANTKVTPEIEKFIFTNRALSGGTLKDQISKKFKIVITARSVERYLAKARADAATDNAAKVEAVRSKILDDADKWANKYLKYTDEEIESLRRLIKASEVGEHPIALETARDRLAASQALQRLLSTIIDFVKPTSETKIEIKQDLSKLSDEEVKQLEALAAKLEGNTARESQTPPD